MQGDIQTHPTMTYADWIKTQACTTCGQPSAIDYAASTREITQPGSPNRYYEPVPAEFACTEHVRTPGGWRR